MIPLRVSELISVTKGRLAQGSPETCIKSFSTDTRTLKTGDFFVPLRGEHFEGEQFLAEALLKGASGFFTPGLNGKDQESLKPFLKKETVVIQVKDGLKALQTTAAFVRQKLKTLVIGITGSTGKTCTKDLLASILKKHFKVVSSAKNYNNEFGVPLTILRAGEETEILILEVAMRAPGEIRELCLISKPNFGIVTNIGEAHFEFLRSEEAISLAKAELVEAIPQTGKIFLNEDDKKTSLLKTSAQAPVITFGLSPPAQVRGTQVQIDSLGRASFRMETECSINLPFPGSHLVSNALAAAAVAQELGLTLPEIKEGLEKARLSPMRMEVFLGPGGITILNDAYNANPTSMRGALFTLKELRKHSRKIAVLGDMLELGKLSQISHFEAGKLAAQSDLNILVTVGEESKKIAEGAKKEGMALKDIYSYLTAEEAGKFLKEKVKRGDVVLLKGSRVVGLEKVLPYLTGGE